MLEDRDYQEIFHMFKVIVESDIGPKLNKLAEGQQVLLETLAPRVYLKTPNAPGQRAFLRCAASFFLEIRQYSCEKMSCATQKSLAAGHIMSFQIHPSFAFKICRAARICCGSYEFAEDFRKNSISEKAYGLMLREAESVCLLFI